MSQASATKTLPPDFVTPFKVQPQASRHDCLLAAVATLTGKTLDEVWVVGHKIGLPKIGQYYVTESHVAALLMQLGGLVSTVWKEFTSFDALPSVCLLWVDSDPKDLDETTGRTVIFHHVKGVEGKYASFSYCLDPYLADPATHVVVDPKRFKPTAYIEVTPKPVNGKRK